MTIKANALVHIFSIRKKEVEKTVNSVIYPPLCVQI